MHRAGLRTALVTLLVLSSLLVYSAAYAQLTVSDYKGETPSSGPGGNGLWDYIYDLSGTVSGPTYWGIVVDAQPVETINPDENWESLWDPFVEAHEYNNCFDGTALQGRSAVIWYAIEGQPSYGLTGFGFQSTHAPVRRSWVSYTENSYRTGTEWSASPEPASMALTSLCLIGVAAWRRRRNG